MVLAEPASDEVMQKVLHYLETTDKVKARSIAKMINVERHEADAAIRQLAKDDKIEYLYLDTTYVKLKGK